MEEPLNIPHHRPRRWHQTALVVKAGRRFISSHSALAPDVDLHQVHSDQTGDEERDLEENRPLAPPTASALARFLLSRSVLVKQIKGKIGEVFRGPSQDQFQQEQQRCSKYSQKALLFAITTFMAYLGSSSASSSTGNTAFKIAVAAFFVAIPVDLISAMRTPKCCYALVYLSWVLLVLLSYLLLISFHKDYGYAIIPVLLLIVAAALLECKLRPRVKQQNTTNSEPAQRLDSNEADQNVATDDKADRYLENIFDGSACIVNCGDLISMILGHYMHMVGPNLLPSVSGIGFLFFFTVVLGLYLMMITTVRTAALTVYVEYFAYLLGVLLVGTLIATLNHGVFLSRNGSHV